MSNTEKLTKKAIAVQIIAALGASIGGIPNGMLTGWTAPVIPKLQLPNSPIPITETDVVWLESIIWIGCIVGLPLTIFLLNRFGSKVSTLIAAVQNLIAWILIGCATSVEFLYVSQFISGIANNNAFVSTPIYISEIADKRIRGFLGTFTYTTLLTGVIVVYAVAPFVSLTALSLVAELFLVVQLVIFPFMPNSPYYLLVKGKTETARKALKYLRATEDVEQELDEIAVAVERQQSERGRLIDLFVIKSNRKAIIIMTMLNFTQNFSGISVTIMNIHSILEDAVTLSTNTAAILFSLLMLLASLCTSAVIDKVGRKMILGCSSFLTGICLFVIAIYFTLKHSGADVKPYNWILLVSIMMYAISFKFGIGLVPIVMTGEIFSTNIKALGVTLADAMYVLFGLASINLYQFLKQNYGIYVPFYIFGCCCFGAGFFTVFYIPETKGKTLEEIQLLLKSQKQQFSYGLLHSDNAVTDNGGPNEDTR
ncbi:hypothetical protein RN001_012526 [Aquatica leii]|uniref:Major facilitator superfamily (MFS) profile domain-containing protein n=1 Tax=Aquatica leii TaxID=1421715 RepID=A0AAN7SF83_9COLE|nr:hypothetical protein RN001_012526 [Aquatica leii]